MKRWAASFDKMKPVLVDGSSKYDSRSLFEDESAAWTHLESEVLAEIELSGRQVIKAEEQLAQARRRAADSAKEYLTLQENKRARSETQNE